MAFYPFVEYVSEVTGGLVQNATAPYSSFYEFDWELFSKTEGEVGYQAQVASRLLPRSITESDPAKTAKVMLSIHAIGGVGMAWCGVSCRPRFYGINPSSPKALAEVYPAVAWAEGATTESQILYSNK